LLLLVFYVSRLVVYKPAVCPDPMAVLQAKGYRILAPEEERKAEERQSQPQTSFKGDDDDDVSLLNGSNVFLHNGIRREKRGVQATERREKRE